MSARNVVSTCRTPRTHVRARRMIPPATIALLLAVAACDRAPQWTVTDISARSGTIVDVHGNVDVVALRPPCNAPAPPIPVMPLDWWNGLQERQRVGVGVVGYQVWMDEDPSHAPPTCPRSFRTEIYRAFFELDLSRYLPPAAASNLSGTIAKAVLVAKVGLVQPVLTAAAIAQPQTAPSASTWCEARYGAAFQLRRLPLAVSVPSGMQVNVLTTPALTSNPPIPTGFPAGTLVHDFPTKDPSLVGATGSPIEIDITQDVVSALQQGARTMVYTITGTTEPQIGVGGAVQRRDAPQVQPDCRTTFGLTLKVSTP